MRADARILTVTSWARLGASTRAPALVALLAAIVATAISWFSGSLTLYGDARAHLDVARHVTDSLTPGLAQLGSVWLPMQHILLVPFVAVDVLWHSALAGSIVGGACYVYSAVRIFGLAEEWLGSRKAAWFAFILYAGNVNLLYVQGTALTEPVLLAFFIGAAWRLARWTRTMRHQDLIMAGVLTACASLTRYDGWFLLVVGVAVVAWWSWSAERRAGATEANLVMFCAVGAFGVALWFLYNLVIFHDPLYFIHSNFSSQSQQQSLLQSGALPTKGSLAISALTYGWAVIDIVGGIFVLLGVAGLVDLLRRRDSRRSRDIVMIAFLAAPVVFNVISLWMGQSTLRVPQIAPFGLWNVRYGLMALPLFALGGAALARHAGLRQRVAIGVVATGLLLGVTNTPATVADGLVGTSSAAGGRPEVAADYIHDHYAGGRVLADEASSEPLMFASGLRLSEFVTIGEHPYYENALASPAANVEWVVTYEGDAVWTDIKAHPERFQRYNVVVHDGRAWVLQRSPQCGQPLSWHCTLPS
jgi:hypothetical protein